MAKKSFNYIFPYRYYPKRSVYIVYVFVLQWFSGSFRRHVLPSFQPSQLSSIVLNIENKQSLLCVGLIYIDFANAFDCVVHRKLIPKLMSIGIGVNLLSSIHNFLADRFQYVCVDGLYLYCESNQICSTRQCLGTNFIYYFHKRRVRYYCREHYVQAICWWH